MQKAYNPINWVNFPVEDTPLNATNLNKMDAALDLIDDRVIELYTTKLDVEDANDLIEDMDVDLETGFITLHYKDGSTKAIPTNLAKVAMNWDYDRNSQRIVLVLSDGTRTYIDLSSLIQNNEFVDSTTIAWTVSDNGLVTAQIKSNSITGEHLQTNYLADILTAEAHAAQSEADAEADALMSKSYAVGGTQTRPNEDSDNSKFYSQVAQSLKNDMLTIKSDADAVLEQATARLTGLNFMLNFNDGHLYYDINVGINMQIDQTTGHLMWEVVA